MDTESATAELSDEERRIRRRHLVQQAIALAMQGRWQDAVDANREIVTLMPDDAEAYNRLGKGYTELGRVAEARAAYQAALANDPANLIAQRNLERLSLISETEASELANRSRVKLDPRFFTEETGKTGVVGLQSPASPEVLATLSAGEQVMLQQQESVLTVTTLDGVYLGRVDEKLSARLTRLMNTGNQYQAGVVGVDQRTVRIIIRETFQAPQNAGRISFPPQAEVLPRPYLREGLLRRTPTVADEEEEELGIERGDLEAEDEEDEAADYGFHEANLDEE